MKDRSPTVAAPGLPPQDSRVVHTFQELSFYAVLAGSTSLIPLPFLDDWAYAYVRRLMIQGQFRSQPLTRVQENLLANRAQAHRTRRGCIGNSLFLLVVTPLRLVLYLAGRLFKKIFFFLALKEASDRAAEAFQEGFLLAFAQSSCSLEADLHLSRDQKILQLSYALEETLRETSASPLRRLIQKVFRGSYGLLFRAGSKFRQIRRFLRRPELAPDSGQEEAFLGQEEDELGDLVQDLEAALPLERRYLDSVAERFQNFARRRGLLIQSRTSGEGSS